MTISQANEITIKYPTKVVILAGPQFSGKTTIIISIYENFLEGPFSGYMFSGSKTILGFEERLHLSRIDSELETSDTDRTKVREEVLLHLNLSEESNTNSKSNILLCDMSGEIFNRGQESKEYLLKVPLISRADHFVLVFDGKDILDKGLRQKAKTDGLTLLRACSEINYINNKTNVDIVFSKQDLLSVSKEKAEAYAFQASIRKVISDQFAGKFKYLNFYEVAARPIKEAQDIDPNLNQLINLWCSKEANYSVERFYGDWDNNTHNEFDKYIWKNS